MSANVCKWIHFKVRERSVRADVTRLILLSASAEVQSFSVMWQTHTQLEL